MKQVDDSRGMRALSIRESKAVKLQYPREPDAIPKAKSIAKSWYSMICGVSD